MENENYTGIQYHNAYPELDLTAIAEREKHELLIKQILDVLKGSTYSQAESVLNECRFEIMQKSVIQ